MFEGIVEILSRDPWHSEEKCRCVVPVDAVLDVVLHVRLLHRVQIQIAEHRVRDNLCATDASRPNIDRRAGRCCTKHRLAQSVQKPQTGPGLGARYGQQGAGNLGLFGEAISSVVGWSSKRSSAPACRACQGPPPSSCAWRPWCPRRPPPRAPTAAARPGRGCPSTAQCGRVRTSPDGIKQTKSA